MPDSSHDDDFTKLLYGVAAVFFMLTSKRMLLPYTSSVLPLHVCGVMLFTDTSSELAVAAVTLSVPV